MGTKIIKTETLAMREMFEYYYSLGSQRSFVKVCEKFNVSETSVKRYAKSFNWTKRVEQRDLANANELERRTNEAVVNSKAMYREMIKELTDQFAKDVKAGKIKIRSTKAFVELVQLDMELMGVGDEESDTDNVASLVDMLKSGWEKIKPPEEEDKGDDKG
jgi:hypothetical protein